MLTVFPWQPAVMSKLIKQEKAQGANLPVHLSDGIAKRPCTANSHPLRLAYGQAISLCKGTTYQLTSDRALLTAFDRCENLVILQTGSKTKRFRLVYLLCHAYVISKKPFRRIHAANIVNILKTNKS